MPFVAALLGNFLPQGRHWQWICKLCFRQQYFVQLQSMKYYPKCSYIGWEGDSMHVHQPLPSFLCPISSTVARKNVLYMHCDPFLISVPHMANLCQDGKVGAKCCR